MVTVLFWELFSKSKDNYEDGLRIKIYHKRSVNTGLVFEYVSFQRLLRPKAWILRNGIAPTCAWGEKANEKNLEENASN
jgi:hypothetical protein